MQELRACWKTGNLPGCNFEHASALEKAPDSAGGGQDIFARGGPRDCCWTGKIDWRNCAWHSWREHNYYVQGEELLSAANRDYVTQDHSLQEEGSDLFLLFYIRELELSFPTFISFFLS